MSLSFTLQPFVFELMAILRYVHQMTSKLHETAQHQRYPIPGICFTIIPTSQISVNFTLRATVFELAAIWDKCTKWPLRPLCNDYFAIMGDILQLNDYFAKRTFSSERIVLFSDILHQRILCNDRTLCTVTPFIANDIVLYERHFGQSEGVIVFAPSGVFSEYLREAFPLRGLKMYKVKVLTRFDDAMGRLLL